MGRWGGTRSKTQLVLVILVLFCLEVYSVKTLCRINDTRCQERIKARIRPKKDLEFCTACNHPREKGTRMPMWEAFHNAKSFDVAGELVYAVPNDASSELINWEQLKGNIALIDRGQVPFIQKILHAQEAGAVGVVLVDNGQCKGFFECGPLFGSRSEGGFASQDDWHHWSRVRIPSSFIMQADGQRLKEKMLLTSMNLKSYGLQYLRLEDGDATSKSDPTGIQERAAELIRRRLSAQIENERRALVPVPPSTGSDSASSSTPSPPVPGEPGVGMNGAGMNGARGQARQPAQDGGVGGLGGGNNKLVGRGDTEELREMRRVHREGRSEQRQRAKAEKRKRRQLGGRAAAAAGAAGDSAAGRQW